MIKTIKKIPEILADMRTPIPKNVCNVAYFIIPE